MDRFLGVIKEIGTMYFSTGPGIQKCFVWSLNAETPTPSVWKDELHVALDFSSLLLNFIVLDMEFCEIKNYSLRRIKFTHEMFLQ
jgi:hypothetical protein